MQNAKIHSQNPASNIEKSTTHLSPKYPKNKTPNWSQNSAPKIKLHIRCTKTRPNVPTFGPTRRPRPRPRPPDAQKTNHESRSSNQNSRHTCFSLTLEIKRKKPRSVLTFISTERGLICPWVSQPYFCASFSTLFFRDVFSFKILSYSRQQYSNFARSCFIKSP